LQIKLLGGIQIKCINILMFVCLHVSCTRGKPYDGCAELQFETQDFFFGNIEGGTDHVTTLYVAVEGVNDRPVLSVLRNSFVFLDDYLPPETNVGFNVSFLITENEVR